MVQPSLATLPTILLPPWVQNGWERTKDPCDRKTDRQTANRSRVPQPESLAVKSLRITGEVESNTTGRAAGEPRGRVLSDG